MNKNNKKGNNAIVPKPITAITRVNSQIKTTEKILSRIKSNSEKEAKNYWKEKLDTLREQEKWKELLTASDICIDQLPDWEYGYFRRATAKDGLQDYQKALEDCDKAIELNNEFHYAYDNRGLVKDKLEDYQGAIDDFTKAIEIDSEYARAFLHRGAASYELENFQEAVYNYSKAIELDYEFKADVYCQRGIAKIDLGDYENAMWDFAKAIELDNKSPEFYTIRGFHRESAGDIQGAMKDKLKADLLNNELAEHYYRQGCDIYELKYYQLAIENFNKAIELDSEYALAYRNRGLAKGELGDEQGAIEDNLKADELESSKLKILLIDDDENLCKILKEELEDENYTINYSLRGEEGLQKLKLDKYNLVILNFNMPGMKGDKVLEQIKRIYPSMPVIILTGYADVDTARKFGRMGASDFVSKPYEFDDLLERVQKFILKT